MRFTVIGSIAVALVIGSSPAGAAGRSFEECRQLAWERGVYRPHYPSRYMMLTGFGEQAKHPKGIMAQCMAGKIH
jgi:hypothetical protein